MIVGAPMINRFSPEFTSTHLGASQIPAAIGVSPYQRPIELWEEYLGLRDRVVGGEAIDLGHALEDGIAREAGRRLNLNVNTCETLEHPRIQWLCATPDRTLGEGTSKISLLQVKTTGLASYQGHEVQERWGEDGSDEVPVHIVAQVQTELLVSRSQTSRSGAAAIDTCHVAALIAGRGLVLYRIPFDEEAARAIVTKAHEFWKCVQEKTPPQVDNSEAFSDFLKRRFPTSIEKSIDADEHATALCLDYIHARDAQKEAEKNKRYAANQLQTLMADAAVIKFSGGKVTWSSQENDSALQPSFWMELANRLGGMDELEKLKAEHTARIGSHRVMRAHLSKEKK